MLFDNLEKMSQPEFSAEYARANELATKIGLDIQTFLQSLLGDKWLKVEQRIKNEIATLEAKMNEAKELIRQFAETEQSVAGKEWLLLYHHTRSHIYNLGVNLWFDDAAKIAGIPGNVVAAWDVKDDRLTDDYDKTLTEEFGGVSVTDLIDTDYGDIGAGWCEFYRSMNDGQTITTVTRRVGNYIIDSKKPIPEDRILEIIAIFG